MFRYTGLRGKRIAVLGYGLTGKACCLAFAAAGAEIVVWDDDEGQRRQVNKSGFQIAGPDIFRQIASLDMVVVSPGIPHHYPAPHPMLADAIAAGVPIDNEIGLFFRTLRDEHETDDRPVIVAVTGSNGKSTTVALMHHILLAEGMPAHLAGNFGEPVSSLPELQSGDTIVLEISSYQSDLASLLEPDLAVFMNFSPDHLDRHGGLGGYLAAKRRLFQGERLSMAIIGMEQPEGALMAAEAAARIGRDRITGISTVPLPGFENSIRCMDGYLAACKGPDLVDTIELDGCTSLCGRHNTENAAAAIAATSALGIPFHRASKHLTTFPGLPHRNQLVGIYNGVKVINDSKATNAASALGSLTAHTNILWIAGGRSKQGGIAPLSEHLANVRKAYLIGESASEFAGQIGTLPHALCHTMGRAVEMALEDAQPGDTILLSPAAASFDQYSDFSARGDDYVKRVRKGFAGASFDEGDQVARTGSNGV